MRALIWVCALTTALAAAYLILLVWMKQDLTSPISATPFSGPAPDQINLLFVGTSLSTDYDWPEDTALRVSTCLNRPVDLKRVTRNGATSRWGKDALKRYIAHADAVKPDVIMFEFTANDADFRRLLSPSQSAALTQDMIADLKDFAPDARIVFLGMYHGNGLRGALRFRYPHYLKIYQNLAKTDPYFSFVNISPDWENHLRSLSKPQQKQALPDGLHPSQAAAKHVNSPVVTHHILSHWMGADC